MQWLHVMEFYAIAKAMMSYIHSNMDRYEKHNTEGKVKQNEISSRILFAEIKSTNTKIHIHLYININTSTHSVLFKITHMFKAICETH